MSVQAAPSLISGMPLPTRVRDSIRHSRSLLDLMYDGFYLLWLIRLRSAPLDASQFTEKVRNFLDELERGAKRLNISADDIYAAKYAFCVTLDELILGSGFEIRKSWERAPLQLTFFGDQLGGEHFFTRLEELRAQGTVRLPVIEVFYMCLLLGFQGKYMLESPEKLGYLVSRLGDEVAHFKGKRAAFAPHWQPPDNIRHALRTQVPIWVVASVFALIGLGAFLSLRWTLDVQAERKVMHYTDVVKLAPQAANFTINLP